MRRPLLVAMILLLMLRGLIGNAMASSMAAWPIGTGIQCFTIDSW
jgi:hypothetical protein